MMSRRMLACFAVTVLAVAALLVTAEPASAQREHRGGSGFGYSHGPGANFGYGNAHGYGNPYYGGGYYNPWNNSYGRGYYPGNFSQWGNAPEYRWSEYNNWNSPSSYSWANPSYYSEGIEGDGSSSGMGSGRGGASYGAMRGSLDNQVMIGVNVPANAEIWFEDQKTTQTGNFRSFISPPLQADGKFVYHIRARWMEDGRQVEKDRKLEVHPGDQFFVNFMKPRSEGMRGATSGQYGAGGQVGTEPETRGGDRSLEHRDQKLDDAQRNRPENADRIPENRTPPRTPTTNPPRTGNESREQTPPKDRFQGDTARPQDKP